MPIVQFFVLCAFIVLAPHLSNRAAFAVTLFLFGCGLLAAFVAALSRGSQGNAWPSSKGRL